MPEFLEDRLRAQARKEGKTGRAADRYVYGAMNNMGAMHGNQETAKGAAMERKHERDMRGITGEAHNYKLHRPKRKILSRYSR